MKDKFPANWVPVNMIQDQVGNICFLFQDKTKGYQAILETVDGQRFDYSDLVSIQSDIRYLTSKDFRKEVFILNKQGLHCVGVREGGVIRKAMTDKWVSSFANLPDGRLLVNTVYNGWFIYDEVTGLTTPFEGPDCGTVRPAFGKGMKQQIIPDGKGNLWFISRDYLVRYDPATNECESFDFKKEGHYLVMSGREWSPTSMAGIISLLPIYKLSSPFP
jgi:hypothetical protein